MDISFQKTKLSRFEINEYLKRRYKNYLTVVANHGDAVEYIESKKDDRIINIFAIDNKDRETTILNCFYLPFEEGELYGLVNYCFEKYKPSKVSIGPILNDIMKITPPICL